MAPGLTFLHRLKTALSAATKCPRRPATPYGHRLVRWGSVTNRRSACTKTAKKRGNQKGKKRKPDTLNSSSEFSCDCFDDRMVFFRPVSPSHLTTRQEMNVLNDFSVLSTGDGWLTYHQSKLTVAAESRPGLRRSKVCVLNTKVGEVNEESEVALDVWCGDGSGDRGQHGGRVESCQRGQGHCGHGRRGRFVQHAGRCT